jgi:hypothetical protein
MKFIILDDEGDLTAEESGRIVALANGILDLCLTEDAGAWQSACALVNVLGFLIRDGSPTDEEMREGRTRRRG